MRRKEALILWNTASGPVNKTRKSCLRIDKNKNYLAMSLILFAVLSTPFSNPVLLSHPLKLPIKRTKAIKENTNRYLRILISFKVCSDSSYFRPLMKPKTITIMAMTSKIWISPPMVYDETNPNTQSTNRITAIVHSIFNLLFNNGSTLTQFFYP